MKFFALFFFLIFIFTGNSLAQDAVWTLKSNKDGIKVYYRKIENKYELKLTTSVKTSLSAFVHLLNETEKAPKWAYKIAASKELNRINPFESYYYSVIDFPWPLSDRDIVMHNLITQDLSSKVVTSTSTAANDKYEEKSNLIRIKQATTVWTIFPPDAKGWAYCEYYIFTDPAGNIPDWMINLAITVGPVETVKALKRELSDSKYNIVRLAHIVD